MTAMNFNLNQPVKIAGDSNFLKGDAIYDVKLKEVKEEVVKSKDKDGIPGQEYNVLTMVFAEVNEQGEIDENSKEFHDKTFPITEQSTKRTARKVKVKKDGVEVETEIENPSMFESTMCKFQLYLESLCPKLYADITSGKKTLAPKGWDEFKQVMIKIFTQVAKSENNPVCKLKLLKNNNFASLPIFTNLSKDGDYYVSNRFIGNVEMLTKKKQEVAFTPYELQKIKERQEAVKSAATKAQLMGSAPITEKPLEAGATNLDDINIDDIDL